MLNVFVSYSLQGGVLARQPQNFIAQHGIEVFLAEISIEAGADWKRRSSLGVPRSVAMDLVGHETIEASNTYTHVDLREKIAAQEKLLGSLPIRLE